MSIRVLIADDDALARSALQTILTADDEIDVVAEAADGEQAIAEAARARPDVVLMDIRMPGVDGLEAARRILESQQPRPRVIMLTTFDLDEYVYTALAFGASGFLLKDVPPERLTAAVRVVADGDALLAPTITRRLVERYAAPIAPDLDGTLARLTRRETDVLALVATGLSNQEIAEKLYLSEATVKTHVSRILAKLDLRDRVQAVVLAYEQGLVKPGRAS
jgi:DNA-binding NarL/FixJ family response regulator